jgi:hypothetical protein
MSAHLDYHTLLRGSKNTGLGMVGCHGYGIFFKILSACAADFEAIWVDFAVLDEGAESAHGLAHLLLCSKLPSVVIGEMGLGCQ